jgi:hypothetical protein
MINLQVEKNRKQNSARTDAHQSKELPAFDDYTAY